MEARRRRPHFSPVSRLSPRLGGSVSKSFQARAPRSLEESARRPFTFVLDGDLVEKARTEVGESDVVRSIEAALAAALDYNMWVREVASGRDALD
jgi:hypothetical protein